MRKHGWQLPYHPLQVVAVAVFLALGFAFYVFFVPFIGRMVFQYLLIGLYTPLVTWVFCLYIWCTATDPGDPGVFKSKKYLKIVDGGEPVPPKESELGGESVSSISAANVATTIGAKPTNEEMAMDASPGVCGKSTDEIKKRRPYRKLPFYTSFFGWCPFAFIWNRPCSPEHSPEKQMSEDGMFYCTLCEVEVFKYSKHCRVCDKCVDGFDHHCRWLNNCIGRKNYRRFFTLMVSALLLLILQWSVGILVMICCFLERKRFSVEIVSKLGSSFSLVPFVVVVASCTILAMLATLPLAQLFFFHVLLIKKGISTYDYIVALREQEQQGPGGQQTPQMSPASSLTGLSSASSFNTFHRGAWCTPPRLFLEDQFDVVPPEVGMSVSSSGKRMMVDEPMRKRNAGAIKISPWTLARLNSEEVSKVAAEVRKKSRIMQPIVRREAAQPFGLEGDSSFGSSSGQMHQRPDDCRRAYKRGKVPTGLPLEPIAKFSAESADINSNGTYLAPETASLAPLQLEARSAFRTSRAMSSTGTVAASSPDSSLDSPDLHPFRVSEDTDGPTVLPLMGGSSSVHKAGIQLSRSTSDGYEASGGEDSDRVPSRCPKNRSSSNWSGLLFSYSNGDKAAQKSIVASSSSGPANIRRL